MSTYSTGTISIGATSTSVSGQGTAWISAGVRPGDLLMAAGLTVPIAAVAANTQLTLARPWPGSALSAVNHDVLLIDDSVRALVAINTLIQTLGNGNLTSLAALAGSANKLPYFSGANVLALADLTTQARGLLAGTALSRSGTTYTLNGILNGTAVTQSPTDTTAARLLKTGDFGLGSLNPRAGAVTLADWLSMAEATGFHHMGNDSETLNKPAGISGAGWGSALTVRTSDSIGARIGWRGFRNSAEFFMQKWDAGGQGWLIKFFNNRNIVGTVVDAAGVPDGAIIETGSNANGRYTRFADGTQICWRTMAAASGAAATWTFPAAFAAAPAVTGTAVATVLSAVCLDAAPTTTAATFSARDKADARRADTCHLRAEGRWF